MIKSTGIILAHLCIALGVCAADCNCTHFPIKPKECVPACQGAILYRASRQDLTSALKLSDDTATAVIADRQNKTAKTVTILQGGIPSSAYAELTQKLDGLDDDELKSLATKYGTTNVLLNSTGEVAPRSAPTTAAKAAPADARKLPKTASPFPLIGLAGLVLATASMAVRRYR